MTTTAPTTGPAEKAAPVTLTTKEVAERLDTDPKTLRRFLRSDVSTVTAVGQGARYSFTAREATSLKPRFTKWAAVQPAKRVAKPKAEKPVAKPTPATVKAAKASKAAKGAARAEKLDAALKVNGQHVSQAESFESHTDDDGADAN